MRRTELVLAALTLMVAMLVAFSAPAMANKGDHNGKNNKGDHNDFNRFNHNDCCDNDANLIFVSDNDLFDDCCDIDDDDFRFNTFGFNHFNDFGCWEWSWVFHRWEREGDCD